MKCYKCEKTPTQGFNLYRQNQKGEVGVWACAEHSKPVDDDLVNVVGAIQKSMRQAQGAINE